MCSTIDDFFAVSIPQLRVFKEHQLKPSVDEKFEKFTKFSVFTQVLKIAEMVFVK